MINRFIEKSLALACHMVVHLLPSKYIEGSKDCFLGDLFSFLSMNKSALLYYTRAKDKDADNEDILKKLGTTLIKIKEYNKAINIYQAIDTDNQDDIILYNWGKALEKQGNYTEAEAKYLQTLSMNPSNPAAYCGLANILDEQGYHALAAEKYNQALMLDPNNADIMISLGLAYEADGELEKASKILKKALCLNPDSTEAHFALGTIYEKMQHYQKAIEEYTRALALDPYYVDVYTRWGEVLYLTGDYDGALEKFKLAIKIDPNHSWALYDMACVYTKINNLKEAVKYIKRAIKIDKTIVVDVKENPNLISLIGNRQVRSLLKQSA